MTDDDNDDSFINKMLRILPEDLITYIIQKYIYLPENLELIRYQKKLRQRMLTQLDFVSNIIHIDNNCCVYIKNNTIVVCNNAPNARLFTPHNFPNNVPIYNSNTNSYLNSYLNSSNSIHQGILNLITEDASYIHQNNISNEDLLAQITSNIESINLSLSATLQEHNESHEHTNLQTDVIVDQDHLLQSLYSSNIVIQHSHEDIEDVVFYILYE